MFIRVKNVKFAFVPPSAESESSFFYRFNQNKLVYNKLQILGLNALFFQRRKAIILLIRVGCLLNLFNTFF